MEPLRKTLQSIYTNTRTAYDKIDEMGGELPANKNLQNLAEAILSIPTGPPIFPPDLSKPLDQAQLDNLQNIVSQGKASEYLNLGDELLVSYGSYTMPFEVVGFEDVTVEGGNTVHAINLLAQYTSETASDWASNGSTKYSVSTLRTYCTSTYQNKLNAAFVACLAKTKVQTYSRDNSTDVVYDKLFAPSMSQLGVTDTNYTTAQQTNVEGPTFTAYKGAANSKRAKESIVDTRESYWTRSFYSGYSNYFGIVNLSGAPDYNLYNYTFCVVVACNFIGKD